MRNINELIGIIKGINFDGIINEKEVKRLQLWVDRNRNLVCNTRQMELIKLVDDILEDRIVTEEEQQKLLQMLSERINGNQFEVELEYLRKLVKARKNIGIDLIDILDNEAAINKIHYLAEVQLRRSLASYTGYSVGDSEVVFISLVLIAILKYDANFYRNVEATYVSLYSEYSEQKIEGLIRTIISKYKTDISTKATRTRIITTVLSNAIIPCYYLSGFFEFIYDIYKLNFECSLGDDLYEEFKFVYEGLRSNMMLDGDDVQLNVTKKTYKLIKSTKQLIVDEDQLDSVIKLSIIIVNLIDKKIWNKNLKISNPYLKAGYEGWEDKFKDDLHEHTRHRFRSELRSRWEPKYILDNNSVFIVPPIHKVKSEYDYHSICVVVSNGEEDIYINSNPDIREIIGGYQISVNRIKIEKPLGYIRYKLMTGDDTIYDSQDKLCRELIVFNTEGSEIQNNSDYSGTAVFCYKNNSVQLKPFFACKEYRLASESVKIGAVYIFEDTVFNFSSLTKPGILGEKYKNHFIVDTSSQEKMRVYKHVKFLVFESDNTSASFEIVINERIHRIGEYKYTISEREGVNKYVVDLAIDQPGVYSIMVYQSYENKRTKMASFNFALDKQLDVDSLKLDEENYIVTVKSDLLSDDISAEINVREFSGNGFSIEFDGKLYQYCIPYDFDIYRINDSSWVPLNQTLWIGDITQESILDIYGDKVNELNIYSCTGEVLDEVVKLKDRGVYNQVSIGFIMSYKSSYDYVRLVFMYDGAKKKEIRCYNRCVLEVMETEFVFDPVTKILNISTSYHGQGKVFLSINDVLGNQIFKSDMIVNGSIVRTTELESFEKYSICFFEKAKGLSLKKDRMMQRYEKVFYAWDDFIDHSFKISKVYFDQVVRGEFLRKHHYFKTTYVKFLSKESEDLYTGEVFIKIGKGEYLLDSINPVSVEICSKVLDDTMELSITKEGDGLFLDFEKHGIKNTLDDASATDIFSYIIDMNEVEHSE